MLKLRSTVSKRSGQHDRQRGPARPPSQPSQTWRAFLVTHRPQLWAADLLTVHTDTRLGIETGLTPVRARRANAAAERVIGMLRRECLDHLIILNEPPLRAVLAECVRSYNQQRPHRTLRLETPQPMSRSPTGTRYVRPVLGGLQHTYERAA